MTRHLRLMLLLVTGYWLLVALAPSPVLAATTQTPGEHADASAEDADQNLSKFSLEDVDSQAAAIGQLLLGSETAGGEKVATGVIPDSAQMLAYLLTNPPASPGIYLADVLHNAGFAPQAYAQGIGFSALNPVLQVWKAFRNLAYFIYILIFIVVGIMVMLRTKIDQQTVVTVQAALPKLVLTLILITFSYAIAGFVIDLIYLVTYVVIYLLYSFQIVDFPQNAFNSLFSDNVVTIGFRNLIGTKELAGNASRAFGSLIADMFEIRGFRWLASSIAYLIFAVAVVIALFRTLFSLIGSYIGIVMGVIFAPLQLMLNGLPQVNTLSSWFRNLIANAAVFPVISILLIIAVYLAGGSNSSNETPLGVSKNPSYISGNFGRADWGAGWTPPLLNGGGEADDEDETGVDQMLVIIALGMIMLLPEAAKMTKKILGAEDKLGLGETFTKNLGAGAGGIKSVYGFGSDRYKQYQGMLSAEAQADEEAYMHHAPDYRNPYGKGRITQGDTPSARARARRYIQNMFGW